VKVSVAVFCSSETFNGDPFLTFSHEACSQQIGNLLKKFLFYVASTQWSKVWHLTHGEGFVVTRGERDFHWSAVLVRSCMHTLVL
jgi:hypothetical protein